MERKRPIHKLCTALLDIRLFLSTIKEMNLDLQHNTVFFFQCTEVVERRIHVNGELKPSCQGHEVNRLELPPGSRVLLSVNV